MGGFDIFFSKIMDDGKWSSPINMGYPLNTVDDDIFFVTNTKGNRGYFASSKEEDKGHGAQDIYMVEIGEVNVDPIAILKGYYIPLPGEPVPPNSYLLVTNLTEGGDPENYTVRKRDGGYVMTLTPCNEYLVEYFADNNKFAEDQFMVPCEGSEYAEFGGALDLGRISMESRYHWQIEQDGKPYTKATHVDYVNKYGDILYAEDVTPEGTFHFKQVEEEIFDLRSDNPKDCEKLELVLLDDGDHEVRRIKMNSGCIFGREEPFLDGPKWKYQISVDGKPLTSGHYADYVDLNSGEHTFHEPVREDGTFRFHDLPSENAHAFEVWLDDPTLCDKLVIQLLDENNKVVRTTTQDVRCKKVSTENIVANYQEFFGYNEDGKEYEDEDWKKFVADCKKIVETNGSCTVTVLGSASKVPTSSYKNNQDLSEKRAAKAKKKAIKGLKKGGVDISKVTFNVTGKVQGPSYKGDFKNTKKYGPFQYIKLEAK